MHVKYYLETLDIYSGRKPFQGEHVGRTRRLHENMAVRSSFRDPDLGTMHLTRLLPEPECP